MEERKSEADGGQYECAQGRAYMTAKKKYWLNGPFVWAGQRVQTQCVFYQMAERQSNYLHYWRPKSNLVVYKMKTKSKLIIVRLRIFSLAHSIAYYHLWHTNVHIHVQHPRAPNGYTRNPIWSNYIDNIHNLSRSNYIYDLPRLLLLEHPLPLTWHRQPIAFTESAVHLLSCLGHNLKHNMKAVNQNPTDIIPILILLRSRIPGSTNPINVPRCLPTNRHRTRTLSRFDLK